uniref:Retinol-binding protein 2-like n=1 Tax=Sinocyclocheilus grahami TaxID=75366 RepID=A0A672MY91_SINGR
VSKLDLSDWVSNFVIFFSPKITEDVNVAIRKIAVLLQPDKDITENRDHFIIKNVCMFRNYNMDFVVGQEFKEDLGSVDGRNCMTLVTWEGDKLVAIQNGEKANRGWKHWIEDDKLYLELTCEDAVYQQVYKRKD